MPLIIKKKISLKFLGEEYEDAYLEFQSIPVSDLTDIQSRMPKEEDKDEEKLQAIPTMLAILKKYFITGKSPDEKGIMGDVVKDDLNNLDADTAIHCFQGLSGVSSNLEQESRTSSTPSTPTE